MQSFAIADFYISYLERYDFVIPVYLSCVQYMNRGKISKFFNVKKTLDDRKRPSHPVILGI